MKQTTVNEFKDGLNLDLHPLVTPKTVLTDNINGTFITYNGNEFCLQNDRGNKWVANLTEGYTPIGIKEHNGILYIISVNGDKTEIGTFPSLKEPESLSDEDFYKEHDFENNYKALKIGEGHSEFTNVNLDYTVNTPVTIEIQDSYDGTINLILVADQIPTRIINSGFSKKTETIGEWIKRNQSADTNIYHISDINRLNQEINLIRTSNILTNIDLKEVQSGGQFKGGNYTFYIKFGDADYNQTDVVAESGVISVFNGNDNAPSTISGTLLDERTDKMIKLEISGLNRVYSKIYIYYSREYSDTQGFRMTEFGMFNEPIDMSSDNLQLDDSIRTQSIWLTGFEQTTPIDSEVLNVDYHTVDWARAEAQHSNMLFLGNVGQEQTFKLYQKLKEFTLKTITSINQGTLINIAGDEFSDANYYSTKNIYYRLGYWPNEFYRFGIVYILNDGSTTPVFNVRGDGGNDKGVFKTPNVDVLKSKRPIYFNFTLPDISILGEYKNKIKGWFVVRQKRIPITICQALSIGTDKRCYLPVIPLDGKWYIESFLSLDRTKDVGELWRHESGNAAIFQVTGEPHILRPFLENFDGVKSGLEQIKESSYVSLPLYHGNNPIEGTSTVANNEIINWYDQNISSILANAGYDPNRDILIQEADIRNVWDNTSSHNLKVWELFGAISTENPESESRAMLFYVTSEMDELQPGQTYYGSDKSFYIATQKDLQEITSGGHADPASKFTYRFIEESVREVNKNAMLSLDPCVNSSIEGMFDGSNFTLSKEYDVDCNRNDMVFDYTLVGEKQFANMTTKVVFIRENTKSKVMDDSVFSSVAGTGSSAGDFGYTKHTFGVKTDAYKNGWLSGYIRRYKRDTRVKDEYGTSDYYGYNSTHNVNLVRGIFSSFLGTGDEIETGLYSIQLTSIGQNNAQLVREQNNSEYYSITRRIPISTNSIDAYRGDCYICKIGMRILRNFVDNTAPVTNTIVDPLGWERWVRQRSLYGGDDTDSANGGKDSDSYASIVDYSEVNLSDLNAIDLGYWVTFPCLSSYNLGLRALDRFHVDEMALFGAPRSFYPLSGASATNKVGDSYLLNDGLSATVGRKRYKLMPDVPYSKSEFANRIMFSNVHITDAYTNGYRTFQGVSYKDYDKQYGAITKLISLGQNIFVVMEHGLGLVPVNPKALMQTTVGETIHIYGYGVLPDEMTIISQDYGSKYEHSVIRTPIGIYGIDVDARKIWCFSDKQGFQTISDMKIETYLKDYLEPLVIEMGNTDVRTHYNGKKGDLMFTWNNKDGSKLYSICYNERFSIWATKYDWKPIVSENINDEFYSLNSDSIWDHADDVGYGDDHVSQWYGQPKQFEFEFVVSDPIGINKIFDNLQIISNNVQPDEMEITVIGDDYEFKRDLVDLTPVHKERAEYDDVEKIRTTSNTHSDNPYRSDTWTYKFDNRLNQKALVNLQQFKDIYKFGRRIGNIQYKEGSWFAQIEPLRMSITGAQQTKEVRIRDKWAKIRIRYSGENLAIITAIKTLINI